MSKKRRTRQQKVIAQLKRQISKENNSSDRLSVSSLNETQKTSSIQSNVLKEKDLKKNYEFFNLPVNKTKKDYSYVLEDTKKTLTLTLIIILVNFLLFFLTEKNIVIFKMLGF